MGSCVEVKHCTPRRVPQATSRVVGPDSRAGPDGELRATRRPARMNHLFVVVAWVVQSLLFATYLRTFANYQTAAGSLLGIYFLTTFLYVAGIILMVGIELDEQLRKDLQGDEERGILEIVRDVL